MRGTYTPDSVLIPNTPGDLLEWAAAHITRVGIYQSRYSLFSGPGRLAHRRCSVGGALDVAAGRDRMTPGRAYDLDAIRAVYTEAYRLLAEHLDGAPATEPTGRDALTRHKVTVHLWTLTPGRTAQEAAAALRSAAETAHAADRLF
ncbi:DUF6197 family protein [Streptomyces silvensis]|uniref:Uncharacterized protein n=1 Tax=Streptomyces silvensis TaxID=1765722 RepID=A0A0W7XB08_9ACTN|nr:DUF6197 family protein [Streptomyces silvensis]KUF20149.1 hypothetical protein AT728_40220 [Streptomyces silvensis]